VSDETPQVPTPGSGRPTTVIVVDDTAPPVPGAKIDPRFRARRIAVRRQAGRKRLRWVAVLGVVAAVVAVGVALVRSPLLAVHRIEVTGAVYSDQAALAELDAQFRGKPILTVDTDAVAASYEALPWVRKADVRRVWPRGLEVDLLERQPAAAYFADDGHYRVIDREGRVLAALDGQPVDLVTVNGVGPDLDPGATAPASLVGAAEVAAALPNDLRPYVQDMVLEADGGLRIRLVPGGQILFGPPQDVRAKLLAVLAVLANVGDPNLVGTLDVRVPEKPVLTQRAS
jgi:cell division protein FtsQ